MKDFKKTFGENGGSKNPFYDGRSKNSFFYSDGQPKFPGRTKDGKFKF